MAIASGARLGPYEILTLIGSGGMGEVYRARDTKLNRYVALKVFPSEFALDADRLARFKREAQVLASLDHPNIAAIYGIEDSEGVHALVLQLVEGPTLADRIAEGPIPIDEALPIARQIAEALEAAHDQGIIHRDLKPANTKVTAEGTVKVLDFGLAKLLDADDAPSSQMRPYGPNLTNSPTITTPPMTQLGVILGTAAYMSPEQAKGKPVDKRSDIWAFGCVLYEMLTGTATFDGGDVTEILGRVMGVEPNWSRIPAGTPGPIHRVLRRTLEKEPRRRMSDIRDVRLDIEEALSASVTAPTAESQRRNVPLAWAVAAVALLAATVFAIPALRHLRETSLQEMRLQIETPPRTNPFEFAMSPDGQYIVFVAFGEGAQRLWLRPLDKTEAEPMAGTEGAEFPFWSADSRSIGFFAAGKLYRINIGGGLPQALANVPSGHGGAWNGDGVILFAPAQTGSPLLRLAASGSEPVAVTKLDSPRQHGHALPQFLPDGRHFLFYVHGIPEASGIYLGSLDGGEPHRLTANDTAGEFLSPSWLAFVRDGALVARRLDLARGELTGDPTTLANSVFEGPYYLGGFSASSGDRVIYQSGPRRRQLSWFDRSGKELSVSRPDTDDMKAPELSPDGRHVAIDRTIQNNRDVWLMDLDRGNFNRFTFDAAIDGFPLWSPDGSKIVFESIRKGSFDLWIKPSGGAGTEELLLGTSSHEWPLDWSKDGRFLLYQRIDQQTGLDLWALPMFGDSRNEFVVANTPYEERNGQFSPNGRWVAYETNESGRFEIMVQPFPEPSSKWKVSTNGGLQPRWRPDGTELYFIAPDGKLMTVPVTGSDGAFEFGMPVALFPTRITGMGPMFKHQYAVSRDGRFLISQSNEESANAPVTLILNWKPKP
jgi:eukaryotic-like serine/threonine-protein kinase